LEGNPGILIAHKILKYDFPEERDGDFFLHEDSESSIFMFQIKVLASDFLMDFTVF